MVNHVIEARIVSGKNIGSLVYILWMSLSPSQSPCPFKMTRRQFPLIVSYVMKINKSQGQSLQCVGLYLPQLVFNHGQFYVAFLRVQSKIGLKILIHDKEATKYNNQCDFEGSTSKFVVNCRAINCIINWTGFMISTFCIILPR